MEIGLYKTYVSARKVIPLLKQLTDEETRSFILFLIVAYKRNDTCLLVSEQRLRVFYWLFTSLEKEQILG